MVSSASCLHHSERGGGVEQHMQQEEGPGGDWGLVAVCRCQSG